MNLDVFNISNNTLFTLTYIVKALLPPGALHFELRQSVSSSEQSIYHTEVGLDPLLAEGAEFTE